MAEVEPQILVLGSGGRELVIGWAVKRSEGVNVLTAPGNAGTAAIGRNIEINPEDITKIAEFAQKLHPYLTIVGPEVPLAKGIVNEFNQRGLPIFGPTKEAAQLETSKSWARKFLARHGIPQPTFAAFEDFGTAKSYLENREGPWVVKADGLASGKGVIVCDTKEDALNALREITGKYGGKVLIEERLYGREVSVLAITDGKTVLTLLPAEDYKQIFDGDKGPMTGGMGGVCPHWEVVSPEELENIKDKILIPIVEGMAAEHKPYKGILYAGLMKTKDGYKVLEINARGGDPEMQVILPLLRTPLLPVLMAAVKGHLNEIEFLQWSKKTCVGVVLASEGYPGTPIIDREVFGIPKGVELGKDILVFQAGTKMKEDKIVTSSGRALIMVGLGKTVGQAGKKAYGKLELLDEMRQGLILPRKIGILGGGQYRTDVGQRGNPRYQKFL